MVKSVNAIQTTDLLIPVILLKKTDFDTKIGKSGEKITYNNTYITIQDFNKLTSDNFKARLKGVKLATKNDIADFVKNTNLDDKQKKKINKKVVLNKTKH